MLFLTLRDRKSKTKQNFLVRQEKTIQRNHLFKQCKTLPLLKAYSTMGIDMGFFYDYAHKWKNTSNITPNTLFCKFLYITCVLFFLKLFYIVYIYTYI